VLVQPDHHLARGCAALAGDHRQSEPARLHVPSKHLAGVGVMFYPVLAATRARLRDQGVLNGRRPESRDLARPRGTGHGWPTWCGSTTANRILVEQGLRRIRAGRAHPGVDALFRVAGRDPRARAPAISVSSRGRGSTRPAVSPT